MGHHFLCTACGKCCYGQIPLTIVDAYNHAERFPLAMVWTPIRQGSKDFAMVSKLGTSVKLPTRKELAVLIVPTAYMPPSFACPELTEDNLCGIHAHKPSRCRTMPFYPYREEQFQAELLTPRKDWACDISATAPVVFADKKILKREDFDLERQQLEQQHAQIQRYADYMLKYTPQLVESLAKASHKAAGQVITSLSSFMTATRHPDATKIAKQQLPVLQAFIEKTANKKELEEFHRNYTSWMKEMSFLAQRAQS